MPAVVPSTPPPPRPTADASEIKTANKRTYILQLWLIYPARTSPRWNVCYRRPSINCDKRANSGGAGKVSQTIISRSQITAAVKCFFHNFLISKSSCRTQAKQAPASPDHSPFPLSAIPPSSCASSPWFDSTAPGRVWCCYFQPIRRPSATQTRWPGPGPAVLARKGPPSALIAGLWVVSPLCPLSATLINSQFIFSDLSQHMK